MKADEIVRALRDSEGNNELDCEISELRPLLLKAANLIESMQAQLAELRKECDIADAANTALYGALEDSRRREKAALKESNDGN